MIRSVALLTLLTASLSSSAFAQTTIDPIHTTNVSGYRGGETTWLSGQGADYGLSGIALFETSDNPCHMIVKGKNLATGNEDNAQKMNICGSGVQIPSEYNIFGNGSGLGNRRVWFDGNPRHFIRGVAVCSNNSNNHRLKGIRIYPAAVSTMAASPHEVNALNSNESAEQPNCSTWHAPVYCPAGEVAVAVAVYHSDRELTGLALRCKRVVWGEVVRR